MSETPDLGLVERICVAMHDAYEAAAIEEGWATQERSRKPWGDVPEANKATMRRSVRAVFDILATEGRLCEPGQMSRLARKVRLLEQHVRHLAACLPSRCPYHGKRLTRLELGQWQEGQPCCDSGRSALVRRDALSVVGEANE